MTTVAKFGGSSLATAQKLALMRAFIEADSERRYIVVSAPGKREPADQKVTDLLRECIRLRAKKQPYAGTLLMVFERYAKLIRELKIEFDLKREWEEIGGNTERGFSDDYVESRGEHLMGKIVARFLNRQFVDPASFITFDKKGLNEYLTYDTANVELGKHQSAVIPGYYGRMIHDPNDIKVFSRGGSDISGAIVARGVRASLYENCTDVCGVLAADPRIVEDPVTIPRMTHQEARELAYMGASVLHPDALFPVLEAGIPTRVLNAADPAGQHTDIVDFVEHRHGSAVGVAGRKGFSAISISRCTMNSEVGFSHNVLGILKKLGISYEHMPGGLDSISLIIDDRQLEGEKLKEMYDGIGALYPNAAITVKRDLAMIAVVGEGMVHVPGTAAKLFCSLAANGINVTMINQGASEMVIGVGVDSSDYEAAIRAIYRDCVEK